MSCEWNERVAPSPPQDGLQPPRSLCQAAGLSGDQVHPARAPSRPAARAGPELWVSTIEFLFPLSLQLAGRGPPARPGYRGSGLGSPLLPSQAPPSLGKAGFGRQPYVPDMEKMGL